MKKTLLLFLFGSFVFIKSQGQDNDESFIRNLLAEQTKQWNNGNIPEFMNGYWRSDSLMFIGKGGVTYGWQNTLENYKKRYPDAAAMGKLQFELVTVTRLSATYFYVVGKWHLTRTIGDVGGAFTLLFQKINDRWLIISDHSS